MKPGKCYSCDSSNISIEVEKTVTWKITLGDQIEPGVFPIKSNEKLSSGEREAILVRCAKCSRARHELNRDTSIHLDKGKVLIGADAKRVFMTLVLLERPENEETPPAPAKKIEEEQYECYY